MAKKKKAAKKRTSTTRRRRVGAVSGVMQNLLFAAAGGVAARVVTRLAANITILKDNPTMDRQIKAAIPVVGGGLLAYYMGKKDAKMMWLGAGMIAGGAGAVANELGIIGNVSNMLAGTPMLGYQPQRRIAGLRIPAPKVAGNRRSFMSAGGAALMG
jgi:hypothetical protein